ncbi:MAG: hypothetical protein MPEBLZ_02865 [Candidatus Methanoperedens nitroreducens]|uniref:Uncharacterized protein n=1 Tax=Candidatus Methanoperedens nitratireducens TaxID=1392998 RepID=A0A0P8DXX3_9EURY|nr:hypothetical protein [Candidatus Methanoperedens sp. BLZ2]KAB2941896.1 MAG: hypothetical protein F9K14_17860 [Candidatus Methanoperedens sp.]KPQ42577.1 MAG: hypothetical protein MPEBLZ_02865 [Candidatus Methanoperedens sp. BLZ1]MBZ0175989.1 hypothetical protein [Candidatus Methanoperedens nitroreducens]MCX9076690.1 hypothetical protein [Candidatus Methanoperedens sp.]
MGEDINPDINVDNSIESTESSKRTRVVTQTKYPLPDSRTDFDPHHLKIISAYASFSLNGSKELKYSDFSQASLGFNSQYISGNNKYLENIGLIISTGGGKYKPTQDCIDFNNSIKWKKIEGAKEILKKRMAETWFWEETQALLEVKKICIKEELIQHLGHVAEADPEKHNRSLRVLIDYLLYVSLVNLTEETGEIKLSNDNGQTELSIIKQPATSDQTANIAQPLTKEVVEEKSIKKEIVQETIIKPEISLKNQVNVNIYIELKISPETSKDDIKGKIEALVEALNALK